MSEPPRLNDLIWLPDRCGESTDGVLQSNPRNIGVKQLLGEPDSQPLLSLFSLPPATSRYREVSTGWMSDEDIPVVASYTLQRIELVVVGTAGHIREEITTPCVMTPLPETITNSPTEFTRHQDKHLVLSTLTRTDVLLHPDDVLTGLPVLEPLAGTVRVRGSVLGAVGIDDHDTTCRGAYFVDSITLDLIGCSRHLLSPLGFLPILISPDGEEVKQNS